MKTEDKIKKEKLVRDQGKAYQAALAYMLTVTQNDQKEVGDYIVTVACEKAEGMYMPSAKGLKWMIPTKDENLHVEVAVQDKETLVFLPHLDITGHIFDESKKLIGKKKQPFIWHPFLFHYGINWTIPKSGLYSFNITIAVPQFHRHDELIGKRYEKEVEVRLGPLKLQPGQKPHGPE